MVTLQSTDARLCRNGQAAVRKWLASRKLWHLHTHLFIPLLLRQQPASVIVDLTEKTLLCCDPTGVSLVLLHSSYSAALDQQAPSVSLLQQQAFIAVSVQNKHEDDLDLIQKWIENQWVHDLPLRKKVPEYKIRCDAQ